MFTVGIRASTAPLSFAVAVRAGSVAVGLRGAPAIVRGVSGVVAVRAVSGVIVRAPAGVVVRATVGGVGPRAGRRPRAPPQQTSA
jgi:hypothetical protein